MRSLVRNLTITIVLAALPVWAGDRIVVADFSSGVDASKVPIGWEVKEKSGKADFAIVRDSDVSALRLRSADTSFSLQREVHVDLKVYPIMSWKWKVTKLPSGGDFRKSKTDDQAAQLFVAFTRTKSIVYIWDTNAPQGLMEDTTPVPFMHVKVVVVRSGTAGTEKWITEARNVYEDYQKLFGGEPPAVSGIRIQINSQHTGTSAESYFADVIFARQ